MEPSRLKFPFSAGVIFYRISGLRDRALSASWLHADPLQPLQRVLLSGVRGGDHREGGRRSLPRAGHAGIAHDGAEVLEQGTEAVRRRPVRQSLRASLL